MAVHQPTTTAGKLEAIEYMDAQSRKSHMFEVMDVGTIYKDAIGGYHPMSQVPYGEAPNVWNGVADLFSTGYILKGPLGFAEGLTFRNIDDRLLLDYFSYMQKEKLDLDNHMRGISYEEKQREKSIESMDISNQKEVALANFEIKKVQNELENKNYLSSIKDLNEYGMRKAARGLANDYRNIQRKKTGYDDEVETYKL